MEARINARTDRLEVRFDGLEHRFDGLEQRVEEFARGVKMQIEQVRDDLRLSFEGSQALREVMERRFDEARQRHDDQHALLRDVMHNVRGRVEMIERRDDC